MDAKTKPGKKRARLNMREVQMLKGIAEGMNPTEAAIKAGYKKTYAQHNTRTLGKTRVSEAMDVILDRVGLTDEAIARKIAEGVNAKRQVVALSGDVVGETSDHKAQFNYVQLACRLKGKLTEKHEVEITETHADWLRKVHERNRGKE